jgi:hypothetical protein
MKAISTHAIITGIRSKQDRSLSLTVSTPELSSSEKTAFLDLQGLNSQVVIAPLDEEAQEVVEVEEKMDGKTPSQRLRGALWVYWNQKKRDKYPDFESFYRSQMERFIDSVKSQIE